MSDPLEISDLPPDKQQEIIDFVEFIRKKQMKNKNIASPMHINVGDEILNAVKDIMNDINTLPADASVEHDHYIYGTPKTDEKNIC